MKREEDLPMGDALTQKCAEPHLCSGTQMFASRKSIAEIRLPARSDAIDRGANIDRAARWQRSELVRRANALKEDFAMRRPHPRKKNVRGYRSRCSVFATVRVRAPSKPNKAPEPTSRTVTPRADARVAPVRAVAHL